MLEASVAGRIVAALTESIVTGEIESGAPLRQDHVAARFGSSPGPVREAFRLLESRGLVVSRPRRGVVVAPLDAASVRETALIRAELEVLALRTSMPRMDAAAVAALEDLLRDGRKASGVLELEAANRRFHAALTERCDMPRLRVMLEQMHAASSRALIAMWTGLDGWRERSDREHADIVEAIRHDDPSGAERLLRTHVAGGADALIERLGAFETPPSE